MQNLKFTGSFLKNPSAHINSTATNIFKNKLDLSQTTESIFKDDEPVTPFSDIMMDDYNPFAKDPENVHVEESSSSSDAAASIASEKN